MKRGVFCAGFLLCAALGGAFASAFEPIDASLADSVFSPYTFLSGFPPEKEAFASRAEAPGLAGPRLAAIDEGLSANSAARLPDIFGWDLSFSPTAYGGYYDSTAFAGAHLRGALAYYGLGTGFFLAADLGAEYEAAEGLRLENGGYWLSGAAAGGLAGQIVLDYAILPWILAFRLSLPEQAGFSALTSAPEATLLLEAVAITNFIGQARFFTFWGLGLDMTLNLEDLAASPLAGFARLRFTIEKRRYQGALYSGWAGYAGGEVQYDVSAQEISGRAAAGLKIGSLVSRHVGSQLGLRYRYSSAASASWDDNFRCLSSDSRATTGTMGLIASYDLPVSLIRLVPTGNENRAAEWCLKPFLDAAFIQPLAGSALFVLDDGLLSTGLELALSVDRDRIQAFHLSAGFDLSSWLRSGFSAPPTMEELFGTALVIEGGFRFVLPPESR